MNGLQWQYSTESCKPATHLAAFPLRKRGVDRLEAGVSTDFLVRRKAGVFKESSVYIQKNKKLNIYINYMQTHSIAFGLHKV